MIAIMKRSGCLKLQADSDQQVSVFVRHEAMMIKPRLLLLFVMRNFRNSIDGSEDGHSPGVIHIGGD